MMTIRGFAERGYNYSTENRGIPKRNNDARSQRIFSNELIIQRMNKVSMDLMLDKNVVINTIISQTSSCNGKSIRHVDATHVLETWWVSVSTT